MKAEQKELIEAVKDLLNPFLYATKCEKLEIAKALNRIADKMGKK